MRWKPEYDHAMTQTSDSGRESAEFDFAGRTVALYKPTTGQAIILVDVLDLGDPDTPDIEKVRGVHLFSQMLRSLFVDPDDLQHVRGRLARGEAEAEDFIGLAYQMVEHWMPDQANNREERRAQERASTRRPAKAAPRRPAKAR